MEHLYFGVSWEEICSLPECIRMARKGGGMTLLVSEQLMIYILIVYQTEQSVSLWAEYQQSKSYGMFHVILRHLWPKKCRCKRTYLSKRHPPSYVVFMKSSFIQVVYTG